MKDRERPGVRRSTDDYETRTTYLSQHSDCLLFFFDAVQRFERGILLFTLLTSIYERITGASHV